MAEATARAPWKVEILAPLWMPMNLGEAVTARIPKSITTISSMA